MDAERVTVPSPCRDICQLNDALVCMGCGRTALEIQEWPRANNARCLQIRAAARLRIDAGLQQELEAAERRKLLDRYPP